MSHGSNDGVTSHSDKGEGDEPHEPSPIKRAQAQGDAPGAIAGWGWWGRGRVGWIELAMAGYVVLCLLAAWSSSVGAVGHKGGAAVSIPFLVLFLVGYSYVALAGVWAGMMRTGGRDEEGASAMMFSPVSPAGRRELAGRSAGTSTASVN